MVKALKDFVDNEGYGRLPVRGTLPDMTADTFKYISLQQLYVFRDKWLFLTYTLLYNIF